jgi:cytidylate kinase
VIAVDGPSGTGKSTVARKLADSYGAAYLDTGAMYRAATLAVLRAGLDARSSAPGVVADVVAAARSARIEVGVDPADPRVRLDGEDVAAEIRAASVTGAVSAVSAHPELRAALVAQQRRLISAAVEDRDGGIVVEGRDIGTVVAPDAGLKVFLTASPRARAARRTAQDRRAGRVVDEAGVLADVQRRDRLDSGRSASPLRSAPDAVALDTTGLSVSAVLTELARLATDRGMIQTQPSDEGARR